MGIIHIVIVAKENLKLLNRDFVIVGSMKNGAVANFKFFDNFLWVFFTNDLYHLIFYNKLVPDIQTKSLYAIEDYKMKALK